MTNKKRYSVCPGRREEQKGGRCALKKGLGSVYGIYESDDGCTTEGEKVKMRRRRGGRKAVGVIMVMGGLNEGAGRSF